MCVCVCVCVCVYIHHTYMGFPGSSAGNLPAMQETLVQFPGQENPLEKG